MKTKIILIMITVLMIINSSCKKETLYSASQHPSESAVKKIQQWYQQQLKTSPAISGKDPDIPIGIPEWEKIHFYMSDINDAYIIPMQFKFDSTNANQFIFIETNKDLKIISAEYVYILLDNRSKENFTKVELEGLLPSVFELTKTPKGLSAWIMKYDMDKKFIISKYLNDEKILDSDNRFKSTLTTRAPKSTCLTPLCIDWFYQIYENGILIYEEYLYSTCSCMENNGGGGGGGGNGSCNMTLAQAQSIADAMYVENLDEHSSSAGMMLQSDEGGIITQSFTYHWKFCQLHYFGDYVLKLTASFPGIRYKYNPGDQWKWLSITYGGSNESGSVPPCFSTISNSHLDHLSINGDGTASATISFSFLTTIYCLSAGQVPLINSGSNYDDRMEAYE